jgi:hypothetical protein
MKFKDIPKFIHGGSYACDVPWTYLADWLTRHQEDGSLLDLDPDFQRGHVWDDDKRARYVEYILRGGTSSKDLWWNCKDWMNGGRGPLMIVDGKQRMEAVRKFMSNELPIFHDVRRQKEPKSRKGWLYSEFEGKLGFMDATFRMHVNNLPTRELVLQWYLDLNEGGVVHTKEELFRVRDLLDEEKKRGK